MPLTRVYQRIRELEDSLRRWEESVPPGTLRSDHLYHEQVAELKELKKLVQKATKKSPWVPLFQTIKTIKVLLCITVLYLTIREITNQYFEFKENLVLKEIFDENNKKFEHYQRLTAEENAIKYCVIRRSDALFKYNIKDIDDKQLQEKMKQIEDICTKQYKTMY